MRCTVLQSINIGINQLQKSNVILKTVDKGCTWLIDHIKNLTTKLLIKVSYKLTLSSQTKRYNYVNSAWKNQSTVWPQ